MNSLNATVLTRGYLVPCSLLLLVPGRFDRVLDLRLVSEAGVAVFQGLSALLKFRVVMMTV